MTHGEVPRAKMDYKVPENNALSAETLGQYPTSLTLSERKSRRQAIDILESRETRDTNYGLL